MWKGFPWSYLSLNQNSHGNYSSGTFQYLGENFLISSQPRVSSTTTRCISQWTTGFSSLSGGDTAGRKVLGCHGSENRTWKLAMGPTFPSSITKQDLEVSEQLAAVTGGQNFTLSCLVEPQSHSVNREWELKL